MRPVIRFSADADCPANGIGSPSENLRAMLARKIANLPEAARAVSIVRFLSEDITKRETAIEIGNSMKILMVLTSHDKLGNTGRKTGFWLEEFAAPYYVFKDAGAEIVLASPKGGQPPLDPKSNEPNFQTDLTRRFEADAQAKARLATTVRLDSVKAEDFDTVFYPGGHGPMWDLAENGNSIKLLESFLAENHRVGLPLFRRAAQDPKRQAPRRGQDRDRLHQWRGGRGRIDEGGTLPCRGRTDAPRCHLFQGQELGRSPVADGQLITGQNPASSGPAAKLLVDTLNRMAK